MRRMKTSFAFYFIAIMFLGMGLIFFGIGAMGFINPDFLDGMSSKDQTVFLSIFMGIGGLFALIGLIWLIILLAKGAGNKRLMTEGYKLEGTVVNATMNSNVRINGIHPFKLECRVNNPYDGNIYLYSSANITDDVSHLIGQTVNVYVDKNNPKKYYVDAYELINRDMVENNIIDFRR